MLVATFGPTTERVGKTISFDDDQFVLDGHGPITAREVLTYEQTSHLVWVSDEIRGWVGERAAYDDAAAAPAVALPKGPVTDSRERRQPQGRPAASTFSQDAQQEALSLLVPGEQILAGITQKTVKPKSLVLTDRRVMIISKGIIGMTFMDFNYHEVADFHYASSLTGATITVTAESGKHMGAHALGWLPKDAAKQFYTRLQEVEMQWAQSRRQLQLEQMRAASGASTVHITAPEAVPAAVKQVAPSPSVEERLVKLEDLKAKGLLTDEEYQSKRASLIAEL